MATRSRLASLLTKVQPLRVKIRRQLSVWHTVPDSNPEIRISVDISENCERDWNDYASVSGKAFHDHLIYKQMYPDPVKRTEFLKYYYDYLGQSTYFNGYGNLVRISVSAASDPNDVGKTIGGIHTIFSWNKDVKIPDEMINIDHQSWQRYQRRKNWLQKNIFDRTEKIASNLDTPAWHITGLCLAEEYRKYVSGVYCAGVGVQSIYAKKKLDPVKLPIVYAYAEHTRLAEKYMKEFCKLVQVYECDDGNNFAEEFTDPECTKVDDVQKQRVILIAMDNHDPETWSRIRASAYDKKLSVKTSFQNERKVFP